LHFAKIIYLEVVIPTLPKLKIKQKFYSEV